MHLRTAIAISMFLFLAIIVSSFLYGIHLLYEPPRAAKAERTPSGVQREDLAAQLLIARKHLQQGEVEQAIVAYRRVLATSPSLEGQLGLAEGELLAGRRDIAAQEFERALKLDPQNTDALLALARIEASRAATWPLAEKHYLEYARQKPDDARSQLELGRLLMWGGKPTQAIEILSRPAVQALMSPQDTRAYAFALVKAGRPALAEPILQNLSAAASDDDALLQLAGLRAARGDWPAALPLYESVLRHRPEDPEANLAYGSGLLASGDAKSALPPLSKAARMMPTSREAAIGYARALRTAGDARGASREFERAAPLYADDAGVNREYGDLLFEGHDYARAEAQYRRSLGLGLRDDRLLLALAGALSADSKAKEAIPLLEEVYAHAPNDRLALDLAKLYRRVGRNDRALELLRTIQASPQKTGS